MVCSVTLVLVVGFAGGLPFVGGCLWISGFWWVSGVLDCGLN